MTPEVYERVGRLFLELREYPSEQRASQLPELCTDSGIRREVSEMLERDHAASSALDQLAIDGDLLQSLSTIRSDPFLTNQIERIGNYRIIEKIGEGGMGVVYRAEQENPRRDVAVKLLKTGFHSDSMLARFALEASILGQLQHTGIAQIFEAGTTELSGGVVPFFAMELVPGRGLIDYADANQLSTRERLDLIARISDAVQHAHQKGVLHRDLKPANVLVDVTGQPKILDFGVARALDPESADTSPMTKDGQIVGTLAYMSPEQVSGLPGEMDTRTDVYGLGAIAYELLTGRPPHTVRELSLADAVLRIRELEPTRAGDILPSLRGDVEIIVAKALSRERDRRYATASELAADIRRYFADEPILARPPSAAYRFKRFVRRNRRMVAVSAAAAILVLAVSMASYVQIRADRDRARSVAAFNDEVLGFFEPRQARSPHVLLREPLDRADRLVSKRLGNNSLAEADVRERLGENYSKLSLYKEAEAQLRRVLELRKEHSGERTQDTAHAKIRLGYVLKRQGNLEEAERLYREALGIHRDLFGDEDDRVSVDLNYLAMLLQAKGDLPEAEQLYGELLERRRRKHGDDDERVANIKNNLALCRWKQKDYAGAEGLFREALKVYRVKIGESKPLVLATSMNNLADVLCHLNQLVEAEALASEALQVRRQFLGNDHLDVASSLKVLGAIHLLTGDLEQAEAAYSECLEITSKKMQPESRLVTGIRGDLGSCLLLLQRFTEAEPHLLADYTATFQLRGAESPETIERARRLVELYNGIGDEEKAAAYETLAGSEPIQAAGEP